MRKLVLIALAIALAGEAAAQSRTPDAGTSSDLALCAALKKVLAARSETPRFRSISSPDNVGSVVFPGLRTCKADVSATTGVYSCSRVRTRDEPAWGWWDRTRKEVEACFGRPMVVEMSFNNSPQIARLAVAGRPPDDLQTVEADRQATITVRQDMYGSTIAVVMDLAD